MFPNLNLFSHIPCPHDDSNPCNILNCFFKHPPPSPLPIKRPRSPSQSPPLNCQSTSPLSCASKRVKIPSQSSTSITSATTASSSKSHLNCYKTSSSQSVKSVNPNLPSRESLNPRLVQSDPVGHAKRYLYLVKLHQQLIRLNEKLSTDPTLSESHKSLVLTPSELIIRALDEEEKYIRQHGLVYSNLIKQRIVAYQKMSLDDWIGLRQHELSQSAPSPG